MTRLSLLDLSPIIEGGDAALALRNTRDLAQHAERWGYHRYWLAEHHNMTGVASAATALVIAHVAAATSTMRVGAGGIMLPNHAPLIVAEQFGTLAALYPDRIDLGLGRAPGADQATARALRRHLGDSADTFAQDVLELQSYFRPAHAGQAVQAVPGAGLAVPVWLLGSSLFSAQLAAELGLPFAFAAHFAPAYLAPALALYRARFRPSAALSKPYAMICVAAVAADTDDEARHLFTSLQQQFLALVRGTPGPLKRPVDSLDGLWSSAEQAHVDRALGCAMIGAAPAIRQKMADLRDLYQPDELMVTAQIYEHAARLHSFEIVSSLA
jgi:luciferase family oxidoreductase group 1